VFSGNNFVPAARSEGLLIQPVGAEWVVYDDETKEAHCLSPFASLVFANADGQTKVGQLVTIVSEQLGEPVDERSIRDAIAQLDDRGLLVGRKRGLSRREVIKAGTVAAASVPMITSVFAAPAWAGASKTCGQLLCCTCNTGSGLNANDCCFIKGVTVNCECTNAGGDSCKFCKPSGTGAPSDADCQQAWTSGLPGVLDGSTPLTRTVCNSAQSNKTCACNCGPAGLCPSGCASCPPGP
jgi:hypothetical protein